MSRGSYEPRGLKLLAPKQHAYEQCGRGSYEPRGLKQHHSAQPEPSTRRGSYEPRGLKQAKLVQQCRAKLSRLVRAAWIETLDSSLIVSRISGADRMILADVNRDVVGDRGWLAIYARQPSCVLRVACFSPKALVT